MAEELVLQKPPPFFAAEFDILSWYSIILWKLSQTCHFYLERQKQVQHSPTVCFNAFLYWPRSRKTSIFLTCYSWLTTDNNINNSTFVYIFLLLNFDSDGLTNKIFTTIHIFMTNLCTNINNFFENCVSLSFFRLFDVLSSAGSVVLGKGQRCQIRVSRQSPKNLRKSPNWHVQSVFLAFFFCVWGQLRIKWSWILEQPSFLIGIIWDTLVHLVASAPFCSEMCFPFSTLWDFDSFLLRICSIHSYEWWLLQ